MPVLPKVPLCRFRFLPALRHEQPHRPVLCRGDGRVRYGLRQVGNKNIYATHYLSFI